MADKAGTPVNLSALIDSYNPLERPIELIIGPLTIKGQALHSSSMVGNITSSTWPILREGTTELKVIVHYSA